MIMDLPLTALIPADYIVDTELRLATYRRIAAVEDERSSRKPGRSWRIGSDRSRTRSSISSR